MVLTVLLPSCTGNESNDVNISCIGCSITLQPRRYEENGCANQKWAYDEVLGFLFPFNATLTDKGRISYSNIIIRHKNLFQKLRQLIEQIFVRIQLIMKHYHSQ